MIDLQLMSCRARETCALIDFPRKLQEAQRACFEALQSRWAIRYECTVVAVVEGAIVFELRAELGDEQLALKVQP